MAAEKLNTLEIKTTVTLIPALPEDLKELNYYRDNGFGGGMEKVMKLRYGLPFWLLSPNTNEIEPHHYILSAKTNPKEIAKYLQDGTIYISKDPYKN